MGLQESDATEQLSLSLGLGPDLEGLLACSGGQPCCGPLACDAQGENADRCTDQVVSEQRLCSRSAQRVLPERGCEPRHGDGDARGDQQVGEQVEQGLDALPRSPRPVPDCLELKALPCPSRKPEVQGNDQSSPP